VEYKFNILHVAAGTVIGYFGGICCNYCLISVPIKTLQDLNYPIKRVRYPPLCFVVKRINIYPKYICKFSILFISICLTFRKSVGYTLARLLHSIIPLIYSM
jgi:hypothetical protein